jgi:DNA gyrase subunit A
MNFQMLVVMHEVNMSLILLAFKPDESIAQVIAIPDYQAQPFLVIATRGGIVKKTPLVEYDSPRSGGLIAVTLKENDEVVSAALVSEKDELLLVSKMGMSLRFGATDESLRPMGRSATGVIGMKFRKGDNLLSMAAISSDNKNYVFTATDGGYAKANQAWRSTAPKVVVALELKAAKIDEDSRGVLVGAMIVQESDEILAISSCWHCYANTTY